MARKPNAYTAEDIEILEDLSPILHRPGMYTDPSNPNHALVEIIDNATDEGLAGFAKNVAVVLYEDGSAEVTDDGRGIPVDIHPKKNVPAVQVIFTTLHSGGKFRKTDKDAAYRIAGGLHGVGVCVPNALSTRLEVEVKRDGEKHRIVFAPNGEVKDPLKKLGQVGPRDSGTRVRFWPDGKYFDSPKIVAADVARIWPNDGGASAISAPVLSAQLEAESLFDGIASLAPKTDLERFGQSRALQLLSSVGETRRLLVEQSSGALSRRFLSVLVSWSTVLFFGFGLLARFNGTVVMALFVGALSVTGAIFLILEMNQPYAGWMQVSSAPLHNALMQMGR